MCRDTREPNIADTIYYCKKTIVKARVLYKHGAHSNIDTTATLSIRQRPTSSASCIARLQFLIWVLFHSRVECDLLCHLATTRCPPGVQEIAAQYIHRGCGAKLFVECTFGW